MRYLLSVAVLVVTAGVLNAATMDHPISFSEPILLPASNEPHALVVADFNNDKRNDIAVVHRGTDDLWIYINQDGFSFVHSATYPCPDEPYDVDTADFNHDGFIDLVSTSAGSGTLYIFMNDGIGGFSLDTMVDVGTCMRIETVDLDGDGNTDIITTNYNEGRVNVRFTDSTGQIVRDTSILSGPYTWGTTCNDYNGDGFTDIAVSVGGENSVKVFLNDGSASFQFGFGIMVGDNPQDIASADLESNSFPDIVVGDYFAPDFRLVFNNGDSTLAQPFDSFPVPLLSMTMANVADLDFDGDIDVLISYGGSYGTGMGGGVKIYSNDGAGTLTAHLDISWDRNHCKIADIDGLGGPDLVLDGFFKDSIAIFLNTTVPLICGDINHDSVKADISDLVFLVDYMFAFGPPPPEPDLADLDGNGAIDISDLVFLVDYMFTGGPAPVACP